jgi:putative heme iron utilization protein
MLRARSAQRRAFNHFATVDGFPFGSVAPFMLDHAGCPVILISTLAEHTKNIDADPRVSLIVQPYSPDMQVAGRVTVHWPGAASTR